MDDLQFDKAEYTGAASDGPPTVCAACQNVLAGFVKAALGGVAGGIAGALVHYLGVNGAWKINRRVPLVITGPFPARAPGLPAFPPPVPATPGP